MITWEQTTLPLPTSLRVRHRTSTQRKKTESGRYQIRKRYSTDYEQASLSFQFINDQFQLFKGIWLYNLNNGSDWFYIDLPVGGDQSTVQCKVRFISDYSYTYINVDNSTVRAEIEFFRVEQPSQLTVDNLTTISSPTPYQEQNLYLYYGQAETPDSTDASFTLTTVNTTSLAVQWWDGSITTHTSNTIVSKAIPLDAVIGQEYKVIAWACTSLSDTTPKGGIKNITANQNLIRRINTKELLTVANINSYNAENLTGEFGNEIATFPFGSQANEYIIRDSEKIEAVVLDGYEASSKLNKVIVINCNKLSSFSVSTVNNKNVYFDNINLQGNNLSGTLNLSNVIFDKAIANGWRFINANNNSLVQVRLNKLVQNNGSVNAIDFSNNQLINIIVEDELIVLGSNATSNLRTNDLNVTAIYNLIENMSVTGSGVHIIRLLDNPCWVKGALDPNDPEKTATLALATSKNISLQS